MTCEACKTIPPVVTEGYEPKGRYEDIAGLKTYVTGDESTATRGIIDIYDIFGLVNQTLQGADLLAATLNAVIIVPDLFKGELAKPAWFGNASPEEEAAKDAFLAQARNFPPYLELLAGVMQAATVRFSSVGSWGAMGLCWGGKIVSQVSRTGSTFKASAQVHPGLLAKEDAEQIAIPHIVLASNGENVEVVAHYKSILEGEGKPNVVDTYPTMIHGWMGARADLSDAAQLEGYEKGYNQLAAFFAKHL